MATVYVGCRGHDNNEGYRASLYDGRMSGVDKSVLRDDHTPEAISKRLDRDTEHSYLGDAVLGAIDGCVTTFALVSGVVGAGFSHEVALVLGSANLLADGLSMAVSNYQGSKSNVEYVEEARRREERHIELVPDGEREEVRQIFAAKGFEGEVLEKIVEVITSDRDLWVDTMLQEELGLQLDSPDPYRAAAVTFVAFVCVGLLPLLPFFIPWFGGEGRFMASAGITAAAFAGIGMLRGRLTGRSLLKSGLETLALGGLAATTAFLVGRYMHLAVGG